MTPDAGETLVRRIHEHNPWWEQGTAAFSLPARQKSDFYHLARPTAPGSQFEDQRLFALVGRRGVGKTTLLKAFIHHRMQQGDAPERFLYLPFDADPLYQLQSDEQLRRAVRYYESHILGRIETTAPHFLFIDDVHQIEHPNKPGIDGWGAPVSSVLADTPARHVVVTASAGVQIERELDGKLTDTDYAIQPVLPEKFRDYVFTRFPALEAEETRLSPSSLRSGTGSLTAAIETDSTDALYEELQTKYTQVEDVATRLQSQVIEYLAMGGTISYAHGDAVESTTLCSQDYDCLRARVRSALYEQVPGFDSIQTIADLERLCALAARNRGATPIRYQELVDLFDVDRRTIVDSYLPALSALYLLTSATEYDNSRPRSVRLYLRDTGLVVALAGEDATAVRTDFNREADLARVAAFDHTMRFVYVINAERGSDGWPTVNFWRASNGEVDFVFVVDGTPVPVGLAYRPGEYDATRDALSEFQETYDAPVGFLLVGEVVHDAPTVERLDAGVIQLPYWLYLMLC